MPGVRIRTFAGRWRPVLLIELVALAILTIAAVVVAGLPAGHPSPAQRVDPAESGGPPPLDLPGLPEATAPVLLPGRPGEPARTVAANEMTALPRSSYNNADIRFVTGMIPHHEQALEMARLVASRGADQRLRRIADRILAAQGPEIRVLETWLTDRGLDRDSAGRHQHDPAGMQTAEALNRLAATQGAEFDRLFVDMMIEHHQGAIDMADEVLALGSDTVINELAGDIIAEQSAEINRLRGTLRP